MERYVSRLARLGARCSGPSVALALSAAGRAYTAIPLHRVDSAIPTCSASEGTREKAAIGTAAVPAATSPHLAAITRTNAALTSVAQHLRDDIRRPTPSLSCVRIPRLLVFGGDVVSVTALEALHARMRCVVAAALRGAITSASKRQRPDAAAAAASAAAASDDDDVDAFVRQHITVVCPALPPGMSPEAASRKFTRQYPVARYCVEHGLPLVPVDDPKSLARSVLLTEMLATAKDSGPAATPSLRGHLWHRPGTTVAAITSPSPGQQQQQQQQQRHGSGDNSATSPVAPHTWRAQGRALSDYDLAVVVSFRYFMPRRLLRVLPPVINMHPSLLPRYRGASPIFSALRRNEPVGGVSIIQMRPEQTVMDSGSVLWQCEVPISADMDIRLYFPLVTQIGAAGLCDLIFGEAPPPPPPPPPTISSASPARLPHAASSACSSTAMPSWWALRQHRLAPLVHRRGGDRANTGSALETPPLRPPASGLLNEAEPPQLSCPPSTSPKSCPGTHRGEEVELRGRDGGGGIIGLDTDSLLRHSGCRSWRTLCRAFTHVTPEAVHAASTAHRALFFQNLERASATPAAATHRRTVEAPATTSVVAAPGAAASTATAPQRPLGVPVLTKTVSSTAAAAMALTTAMKCAEVFPMSVLSSHCDWPDSFTYSWRFAQVQVYDTHAHFRKDPYHAPLLPKDAAVVHFSSVDAAEAFGVWRAYVGGDYFHPSVNATLDKGSTPVRNQLVHRGVRRLLRERAKARRLHCGGAVVRSEASLAASEPTDTPVGIVAGKHVELDVFSPEGLRLLAEAEDTLRTPCTFTRVTNPELVPECVRAELAEVEAGYSVRGGASGDAPHAHLAEPRRRRVPFYRAPPPVFRSLLSRGNTATDAEEPSWSPAAPRRRGRQSRCTVGDTGCVGQDMVPADSRATAAARRRAVEPGEYEEAPADYVPDVIHAAPPMHHPHQQQQQQPQQQQQQQQQHRLHIPPGTGYFPESDESYGAIKCREGWLLWTEAHMKSTNKAQPAVLLRKGLAMKFGVLYVGLFSEYS
ncbi:methionyl-tRNA formyltransferase [Novymonas esmeraldas]|uniref:Methionyl-tRNA formyltransferase n=1 Tax=Novymonas esmeraldas TaxID=1808958 RepID=A0AAW0F1S4_9TRYP